MSEVPIEGKVVYVGGRGYGKAQRMREMVAQTNLQEPSVDKGSDWDTPVKVQPVSFSGTMAEMDYAITREQMMSMYRTISLGRGYASNALGHWQETPREELRRRLNNWLRGTYPGEPINWKGLS